MLSRAVKGPGGGATARLAGMASQGLPALSSGRVASAAVSFAGFHSFSCAAVLGRPEAVFASRARGIWRGAEHGERKMHHMQRAEEAEAEVVEEEIQDGDDLIRPADRKNVIHEVSEEQLQQWGGLSTRMVSALHHMGITRPTEIQRMVIPEILSGGDVAMLSETGSGKTLSYLMPLVHNIKAHEEALGGKKPRPRRPRAIVLVPTRELAGQVLGVVKRVSHVAGISSCGAMGGTGTGNQGKNLSHGVDVVVGTPTRVLELFEKELLYFGDVRQVVIDECDTMFASGWGEDLTRVIAPVKAASAKAAAVFKKRQILIEKAKGMEGDVAGFVRRELGANPFSAGDDGRMQITLVAATLTKPVQALINKELPGLRVVRSSGAHRAPVSVRQRFVECKPSQKLGLLLSHLTDAMARSTTGNVMIFCNTTSSCAFVHEQLRDKGIDHASFHGGLPQQARLEQLRLFLSGQESILVSTDVMARGLDIAQVSTVINFDFPTTSVDYIHRIGRTGRAGRGGMAISFVQGYDQGLAKGIQHAIEKGQTIEAVSNSKQVLHTVQQRDAMENREKMVELKRSLTAKIKLSPYASAETKRKFLLNRHPSTIKIPKLGARGSKVSRAPAKAAEQVDYVPLNPPTGQPWRPAPGRGFPSKQRGPNPPQSRRERNEGVWRNRKDPFGKKEDIVMSRRSNLKRGRGERRKGR